MTCGRSPVIRLLLLVAFFAAQISALAHEYEHAFHQHDEPCAQHVLADQLAKAPAPSPPAVAAHALIAAAAMPPIYFLISRTVPDRTARAPPPRQ